MSRIFAPISKFPLPAADCEIDVKLQDGSTLICAKIIWVTALIMKSPWVYWHSGGRSIKIPEKNIVSWRKHKAGK